MHTLPPGAAGEHEMWSDRLSAYLDGELKNAERRRLEAHVASCAACAVTLTELREVMARARTLVDTPPATDLWPAIEAQLEPRNAAARERGTVVAGPGWWGRRFELGLPQLAAAAAVLVVLSAGVMWMVLRGGAPGGGGGGSNGGPVAGGNVVDASASGNPRYDAAVAELEQALSEGKGKLDPRTLAVVQHNLQIIDKAITDARLAVAADPGNTWLRSHLAATMKKKVELLRSATMLASAQG